MVCCEAACLPSWLNSYPGKAEDHCPQCGLLGSLEYCYCVPVGETPETGWVSNGNHGSLLYSIHHVMLVSMLFYSCIAPR